MQALIEHYGRTRAGEDVSRITIADALRVEILTYGGIIARLDVPDQHSGMANVVLGLRDLADYETRNPNFGATIGRFANRIAGARFTLDGTEYRLPANEGENILHGGIHGFGQQMWSIVDASHTAVTLAYVSPAGEAGFPGTLRTQVTFTVEGSTLRLHYRAETDAPTVLNLTNHSYFNLAGEGSGDVWAHELMLTADAIAELRADGIPTGAMVDVTGTPFDFRTSVAVGARVRDSHPQIVAGLGYDCCFVLSGNGMREVAVVHEPRSGRVMTVRTDQPALQLYSANRLTGALVGPSNRVYRSGDGLCLETQHFPDSPNQPSFPSTVLRPGATFETETEYVFSLA